MSPSFNAPRKSLGQHFLRDENIIHRIVESFRPANNDIVVEIGPGRGALTRHLVGRVRHLHLVEVDRQLATWHAQQFTGRDDVTVHQFDALKFDFSTIEDEGKVRIIGNLPYNISTPILFHLLDQSARISDMYFMLQKEVVDRICASPGGKTWGRLSVMMQWRCQVQRGFVVAPGAFNPPPKVDSAMLAIRPYDAPPCAADPQKMAIIVSAAFAQRRKTLRNSLRELINDEQFATADIDPSLRAERLEVADFARLSQLL